MGLVPELIVISRIDRKGPIFKLLIEPEPFFLTQEMYN